MHKSYSFKFNLLLSTVLFAGVLTTSHAHSRSNVSSKFVSEVPSVEINLSVIEELRQKEAARVQAEKTNAFTLESQKLEKEKKSDLKKRQGAYLERLKPETNTQAKNIPLLGYPDKKGDDVENIFPEYRSGSKPSFAAKVPVRKPVVVAKEAPVKIIKESKPSKMLLVVPVLKPKDKLTETESFVVEDVEKKEAEISKPELPEVTKNPDFASNVTKIEEDSEGYLEVQDSKLQEKLGLSVSKPAVEKLPQIENKQKDERLSDNINEINESESLFTEQSNNNLLDEAKKIEDSKRPSIDNPLDELNLPQELPKEEVEIAKSESVKNIDSEVPKQKVEEKVQNDEKTGLFSVFNKISSVKGLFSSNKNEKTGGGAEKTLQNDVKEPEEVVNQEIHKPLNEEKKVADALKLPDDVGLEELPRELPSQKEVNPEVETATNKPVKKENSKVIHKKADVVAEPKEPNVKNIFSQKKDEDIFASKKTKEQPVNRNGGSALSSKALIPVEVEELDEISDAADLRNARRIEELQVGEQGGADADDSKKTPYYVSSADSEVQIILPNELDDEFNNNIDLPHVDTESQSVEKNTDTANSGGVLYLEDIAESLKKQKNSKDKLDNSMSMAAQTSKVTELAALDMVVPAKSGKNGVAELKTETISLLQINFKADELDVAKADEDKITELVRSFKNKKNKLEIVSYANGSKPEEAKRISLKRAIAVRKYLIYSGLNSDRVIVKVVGLPKSKEDANSVKISLIK